MMTILRRYIARTIFSATGLVMVILSGVLFVLTLLGELKNVGNGDYGFLPALCYVLMRLPMELYQFTPILILLSSIAGLSLLSSHRELAIMRASGFSMRQIIQSVFVTALFLTIMISILGESFAPRLSYIADLQKANARNAGEAVVTAAGLWLHVDNNFIHIDQVVGNDLLQGVTRYEFDENHRLRATYYAERMTYTHHQWVMSHVVMTTFYDNRTHSQVLPVSDWKLKFNANLLNLGMRDANEMSLPRLAKFSRYLEQNGLQASEFKFEFWQRVLQPLASVIMILLAIPFVLGSLGRVTLGFRMVLGLLVGFTFFILNALLGQVCVVYQIPAVFAALIPLLVFGGIGVFLLRRFNL